MTPRSNAPNRHARRRQARLNDFALGELDMIPAAELPARLRRDPRIDRDLDEWIAGGCFCLTCLIPFEQLPALWITGRAARRRLPIVGVCEQCCAAGSAQVLLDRIAAGYRRAGLPIKALHRAVFVADGGRA